MSAADAPDAEPSESQDTFGVSAVVVNLDAGDALLTELAEVMLGSSEHFPPANAPAGLLTRIRIERVGGVGPWAS